MRRQRKTKIVATLGPASNTPEMMAALFDAGADVFRINMSHTPHALLKRMHGDLRALGEVKGRPIGILIDLQGPKIRLGTLKGGPATSRMKCPFRTRKSFRRSSRSTRC
jgi:pyruvate kinase